MPDSDRLEALQAKLRAFVAERDWDQFHTPKNLAMALVAEAGELVEHFQWLTPEQSAQLPADTRAEVELEIADVLLFLLRLCDKLGIDPVSGCWQEACAERRAVSSRKGEGQGDEIQQAFLEAIPWS